MDKRALTFGIFLILVFTLGCVSAAENTTTDNATSIAQNYHEDVVEVSMAFDVAPNPDRPIEYGSDILFDVMVPEGASGSIDYTVNSKNFNINVENLYDDAETLGEAGIRVHADELVYGLNTFTFTYIGDDYPKTTVTQKLTVEGNIKPDTVYVGYGNDAHVSLMLPGDASGNLNVYEVIFYDLPEDIWGYGARFNLIQSVPLINGFANVTASSLNPGRHYIYANYTGKDYAAEFKYSSRAYKRYKNIYADRKKRRKRACPEHKVCRRHRKTPFPPENGIQKISAPDRAVHDSNNQGKQYYCFPVATLIFYLLQKADCFIFHATIF